MFSQRIQGMLSSRLYVHGNKGLLGLTSRYRDDIAGRAQQGPLPTSVGPNAGGHETHVHMARRFTTCSTDCRTGTC